MNPSCRRDIERTLAQTTVMLFAAHVFLVLLTVTPAAPQEIGPRRPARDERAMPVPAEILRQLNRRPAEELNITDAARDAQALPSNEELQKTVVSEETAALIRQLDASDYHARRAASEQLLNIDTRVEELLSALARGGLSTEQANRLLGVTYHRIVNAPRGALGIQMSNAHQAAGVRITRVIAGFPAEKRIMVDDLIVAIDGQAVGSVDDVRMLVQGLAPGTIVRVELVRAERDARGKQKVDDRDNPLTRRIQVLIPLGSKRELDAAEPLPMAFPPDPLDVGRQKFGREVLLRFAPPMLNATLPDDAKRAATYAALDAESYDLIVDFKREMAESLVQQRPIAPQALGHYRGKLRELRAMAQDGSYSAAEREWFDRVAKRLEELLPGLN
ncbi:MAG: PDZ domain-containing protein [Phycisphaerae bacterium]|nr:PDZ domain-containing protein [Phycisphaerae bacterium]